MMTWPDISKTASLIEVVWTAASAVAVIGAAAGLGFTHHNLRAARAAHERVRVAGRDAVFLALTSRDLRNERISVAVLSVLVIVVFSFFLIGGIAMLTPAPLRPELKVEDMIASALLVTAAFLLAAVAVTMAIGSALNRRDRHKLTSMLTGRVLVKIREERLRDRERQQAPPAEPGGREVAP